MKNLLIMLVIFIATISLIGFSIDAQAGWLDKALQKTIEKTGQRDLDEASDGAYEGDKKKIKGDSPDKKKSTSKVKETSDTKPIEPSTDKTSETTMDKDSYAKVLCTKANSLSGQKFAKKAKVSKSNEYYDYWAMQLDGIIIPDKNEVCVPAYPKAKIVSDRKIGTKTLSGDIRQNPVITLLSEDKVEKVLAFYKQKLFKWHNQRMASEYHFWSGDKYFSPMRAVDIQRPSIIISSLKKEIDFMEIGLIPNAKTRIKITYVTQ